MTRNPPDAQRKPLSERLIACVPLNWLDPLLTGPDAVIGDPPFSCKDVERLLLAVKKRMATEKKR